MAISNWLKKRDLEPEIICQRGVFKTNPKLQLSRFVYNEAWLINPVQTLEKTANAISLTFSPKPSSLLIVSNHASSELWR